MLPRSEAKQLDRYAGVEHFGICTRFDEAGLIVQAWNLMGGLALMHQLGLLPSR